MDDDLALLTFPLAIFPSLLVTRLDLLATAVRRRILLTFFLLPPPDPDRTQKCHCSRDALRTPEHFDGGSGLGRAFYSAKMIEKHDTKREPRWNFIFSTRLPLGLYVTTTTCLCLCVCARECTVEFQHPPQDICCCCCCGFMLHEEHDSSARNAKR